MSDATQPTSLRIVRIRIVRTLQAEDAWGVAHAVYRFTGLTAFCEGYRLNAPARSGWNQIFSTRL